MKTLLECIWSFKKSRIPYGLFQLLPAMRCVTEVTAHMRARGQTDVGKDVFWLFFSDLLWFRAASYHSSASIYFPISF